MTVISFFRCTYHVKPPRTGKMEGLHGSRACSVSFHSFCLLLKCKGCHSSALYSLLCLEAVSLSCKASTRPHLRPVALHWPTFTTPVTQRQNMTRSHCFFSTVSCRHGAYMWQAGTQVYTSATTPQVILYSPPFPRLSTLLQALVPIHSFSSSYAPPPCLS